MAGNRTKTQASQRLIQLGIPPGYIEEEEAAAYHRMSAGAFRKWYTSDPLAPQPHWLGGCKRFRVSDLDTGRRNSRDPAKSDPIMAAIDAVKPA